MSECNQINLYTHYVFCFAKPDALSIFDAARFRDEKAARAWMEQKINANASKPLVLHLFKLQHVATAQRASAPIHWKNA